jgi:ATP-binding cassette subfamily C (CFTR/MRP) protein 1
MGSILYNSTSAICGDDTFGPAIGNCESGAVRGDFDFTLLFEQSVLSILPSALLLLVVPWRSLQLASQSRKVRKHSSHGLKIVSKSNSHGQI